TVSDWTDGGDFEYQPENELAIGTLTGVGATVIASNNTATVSPDETEYFSIPKYSFHQQFGSGMQHCLYKLRGWQCRVAEDGNHAGNPCRISIVYL
ncbi:hypothetical protein, partial [Bacteroides cellulosilyticus]|uniref:hypothetical protein n=1 Tax=Bacteroides cellulosilyticus TaxID=246787 RepID=UPI0022E54D62